MVTADCRETGRKPQLPSEAVEHVGNKGGDQRQGGTTMKLYSVYVINPIGEKSIEFVSFDSNEADDFFSKIDGSYGWEYDYGIDEVECKPRELPPVKFYYSCENEDREYDFCTRKDALEAIRHGRKVAVEGMQFYGYHLLKLPYIEGFEREWPIDMPYAPEIDYGFEAVEDWELPF